jgi:HD-like signal output (HDOD) protein
MAQDSRDERVAARVEEIASKPDFPAFSHQIAETLRVLGDEAVSAQQLAELVLRNYGLTLKVLRAANSFGANRAGVPIFSVAQAIFRLGVDRVRAIVGGLVFFEHFHAKTGPVKELVVLSLVTAHQAGGAATRIGHPRPEEAYLCGMLRNVGEILVACYFPQDFEDIRVRAAQPGASHADACQTVLGFQYEDLGRAMAAQWGMPSELGATMSSEPLESAGAAPPLVVLTALAHGLTSAVYRGDAREARSRVALLVQKLGLPLGLTGQAVKEIADAAAAEARRVFARMNARSKDVAVLDRARAAQAFGRDRETPAATEPAGPPEPDAPPGGARPALFAELAREVDAVVESRAGGDLHAVLLMVLEAMQRGAGFDRVVFGLVSPDRRSIQGRLAIGPRSEPLKELFRVTLGLSGGPLGTALSRQQEIVLCADWELRPEETDLLRKFGARTLGVLPIVVQGVLVGCLYYDRVSASEPPAPDVEAGLRRLRDRAALVLGRRRT